MSEISEKYNLQNFEKLLLTLSKKININGDGVSTGLQQKCDQAFQRLKVESEAYLKTKIFYDHVVSSFIERKKNSINCESPENDDAIWEMFTKSCLIDLYDMADESILGLNKEVFHIGSDEKKFLSSIQDTLLSKVSIRIQEQYDTLVEVFSEVYDTQSDNPTSHLLTQQMELERLKKQLKVQQSTKQQLFQEYFKSLSSSCGVLLDLMKTYRAEKLISNNNVTISWLLNHCEALNLKIKMQEYQLLTEIYTKDSIKALSVIRNELLKQDAQTSVELAKLSDLLTTYESVGPEFKCIVEQYSRIRDEIENKKWALDEVEKHKK